MSDQLCKCRSKMQLHSTYFLRVLSFANLQMLIKHTAGITRNNQGTCLTDRQEREME